MITKAFFLKCILPSQNINFFRYLRGNAPRVVAPTLIEGKVKTVKKDDSELFNNFESYKDFIRNIEKTKFGNEIEVEKQFLNDDYHGDVLERCDMYYDMHEKESKILKSDVKKTIIGRKYFKLNKETNLLTHAAKEQIRYLHKSDPLEWNCKRLSECFPISEAGVKKLLKSNFEQTCPEKIKLHDEDVAKKWEILKSGRPTDEIFPLTQKLYKEGKLIDDYFSGNPNLPTLPPPRKKVIEVKRQEKIGEFSAIVKTYLDYQKQKLLESGKENTSEKQVMLKDPVKSKKDDIKQIKKYKYKDDDYEDPDPEVYPTRIREYRDEGDISFPRFKEMLKEESSLKLNTKNKSEYDDFVIQETSKSTNIPSKNPQDIQNCFLKIPKYKKDNIDLAYGKGKDANTVYKYDEKFGYQHPFGKNIKGKINVTAKSYKKRKLHKVGSCIYDENGEFLYKVL